MKPENKNNTLYIVNDIRHKLKGLKNKEKDISNNINHIYNYIKEVKDRYGIRVRNAYKVQSFFYKPILIFILMIIFIFFFSKTMGVLANLIMSDEENMVFDALIQSDLMGLSKSNYNMFSVGYILIISISISLILNRLSYYRGIGWTLAELVFITLSWLYLFLCFVSIANQFTASVNDYLIKKFILINFLNCLLYLICYYVIVTTPFLTKIYINILSNKYSIINNNLKSEAKNLQDELKNIQQQEDTLKKQLYNYQEKKDDGGLKGGAHA